MGQLTSLEQLAALVLPMVLAITVHEMAHGWVADQLGDPTARALGRVSLNPLRHIDWFGTVVLPVVMYVFAGFLFGWAKPVPIDPRRLPNPRRDMAYVAAAGPAVNLLMAIGWSLLAAFASQSINGLPSLAIFLTFTGAVGVFINVVFVVINMIPLPPLDGGRVLIGLLPMNYARVVAKVEPFGLTILILLLVLPLLVTDSSLLWDWYLGPSIRMVIGLLPASNIVLGQFPVLAS